MIYGFAVKLHGESKPEHGRLDPGPVSSRFKSLPDLGPEVIHTFEVNNMGPFDVGNLLVSHLVIFNINYI
jgi:hypothetical protein